MKYNSPHSTASFGAMAKDWEQGIDYSRLSKERLARAQSAIRYAGLGDAHRRMGARQVLPLCAVPGRGKAVPVGPGAARQTHFLALDFGQRRRADHDHAGRDPAGDERAV